MCVALTIITVDVFIIMFDNYIIDVLLVAIRLLSAFIVARALAVNFIVQLTLNNFHSFDRSVP
jgi:hypothetical protein